MKATLFDLFTSKKFIAALAAVIIYVAGRFGFDVDPAALDRIFAALLVYVGAQGIADVGKSAAVINAVGSTLATTPEGIAAMKRLLARMSMVLLVVAAGGVAMLPSCAAVTPVATRAESAVVDCVQADKTPIVALLAELAADAVTAALSGGVDWGALASKAWEQGKETGGCAFVALVTAQLKSAVLTQVVDDPPRPAQIALEELRAKFGDVQWRTAAGLR
jgi:acid phosphatase family membrane protein YuiD